MRKPDADVVGMKPDAGRHRSRPSWTILALGAIGLTALLASCSSAPEATATGTPAIEAGGGLATAQPSRPSTLVVMTHDSFDIGEELIKEFENANNAQVSVLKGGDAGEMLTKAILTKNAPVADVLYGIDNTFLARALAEGVFVPYRSPELDRVPQRYRLDSTDHVMPVDFGFVAINYDRGWLDGQGMTPPNDLADLTLAPWRGKLIVQNPATSSPGLAFLLTSIGRFGEDGDYTWKNFWADLKQNDVLVTDGWEDAYYTAFTLAGGDRPLVVSYWTSPAAEVVYSEGAHETPPTGSVQGVGTTFLQVEGIGILTGSKQEPLAQAFIDFIMEKRAQEDFPTRMWVYPANEDASLPAVFQFAPLPVDPVNIDATASAANRDRWIDEWVRIMLR